MKEHIWHLRRHLLAREPLFVGNEITVPGTNDTALVGMARAYARTVLGIDQNQKLSLEQQKILSERGLHKRARVSGVGVGTLSETEYSNSQGELDDGNELVAEA